MMTKPMCATSTPRRAQSWRSANVHSTPPNSRLRIDQPRLAKNLSTVERTSSRLPFATTVALSGMCSIFTARSGGMRAGMTRLNVQTASEIRISPMMPT